MGWTSATRKQAVDFFRTVAFLGALLLLSSIWAIPSETPISTLVLEYAFLRKAHPLYDTGTIHLFLKNYGEKDVYVQSIWLNDVSLDDLPNDIAIWGLVRPNPIPPKRVGNLIIKLKKMPSTPLKVKVTTSNDQSVEKIVDILSPALRITYIGFNQLLNKIYIYLENSTKNILRVKRVYIDSWEITNLITNSPKQISPISKDCLIINLRTPLLQGSYITIKVETEEGEIAEATIRTFSIFPITSWDGDTRKELNFDPSPFLMSYPKNPACLEGNRKKPLNMLYLLSDDPAGADLKAIRSADKAVNADFSLGASAGEICSYAEECYRYDPLRPVSVCLRDAGKPFSYFVYGELSDALLIHPCENVYYRHRPLRDGYWTYLGKLACEPRPLYVLPEAFRAVGRCGASPRFPTPEELRLIVYYELAYGAKGILFFKKSGEEGYEAVPSLVKEIIKLNGELQKLKPLLMIGEPIQLAVASNPQVETYSLLCGDEAIIVLLINHDHDSNFEPGKEEFSFRPIRNFALKISIPDWLEVEEVYEITEGGNVSPLRYRNIRGNKLLLYVKELKLTKQMVVKTRNKKRGSL